MFYKKVLPNMWTACTWFTLYYIPAYIQFIKTIRDMFNACREFYWGFWHRKHNIHFILHWSSIFIFLSIFVHSLLSKMKKLLCTHQVLTASTLFATLAVKCLLINYTVINHMKSKRREVCTKTTWKRKTEKKHMNREINWSYVVLHSVCFFALP